MGCVDLDVLEAKARAATPGPWFAGHYAGWEVSQSVPGIAMPTIAHVGVEFFGKAQNASNASYIAAASPDAVLALIERVRVAEKALEVLADAEWAAYPCRDLPCPVFTECDLDGVQADCLTRPAIAEARRSLGLSECQMADGPGAPEE